MLSLSSHTKLFVYSEPTSMRKSFENLTSGALFVFINRKKDSMKVLYWDQDGLAIWYKRLEKGSFNQNKKTELNRKEFFMLLEGITPKKINRRYSLS